MEYTGVDFGGASVLLFTYPPAGGDADEKTRSYDAKSSLRCLYKPRSVHVAGIVA